MHCNMSYLLYYLLSCLCVLLPYSVLGKKDISTVGESTSTTASIIVPSPTTVVSSGHVVNVESGGPERLPSTYPVDQPHDTMTTIPAGANTTRTQKKQPKCPAAHLDNCMTLLPPMKDIGIPASTQAVKTACRTFDNGMDCLAKWASRCLNPSKIAQFKQSVMGAHEIFAFLCRDLKFQAEYLRHVDCYRRISTHWDKCALQLISSLKRIDSGLLENSSSECCVRIHFMQCVNGISNRYCEKDAARFLQKMAETMVRSTTRNHVPVQCVNVTYQHCSIIWSSGASSVLSSFFGRLTIGIVYIFFVHLPFLEFLFNFIPLLGFIGI